MLKIYSYIVHHDLGLAPNPFGGFCTLAVCKGNIRKSKNLKIGDWIIGTGSKELENVSGNKYIGRLIYAMCVEEIITFEKYWDDPRFQYKKPALNGSLVAMYGDNIYSKDEEGEWLQADSAHSLPNGQLNKEHLRKDIRGENVLIGRNFYYFGNNAPLLPQNLIEVCHKSVGEKIVPQNLNDIFLNWLIANYNKGINGEPINWLKYQQLKFF